MFRIKFIQKLPIIIFGILFIYFSSCEKDDLCDQKVLTPQLVIRFYNKDKQRKVKKANQLLIVGEGQNKALYQIIPTDSLALPLKINENETTYQLIQNAILDKDGKLTSGESTKITIRYKTEEIFVSKACGYKVIFNDLGVTTDNPSWISSIKINKNTVKNENEAQVYLYH